MRAGRVMLAVTLLAACNRQDAAADNPQAQLHAAHAAYDRALLEGDAAALDRFYTDDFRIIDDDGEVSDKREQIRFMTQDVDLLQTKSDDVRTTMLGPDTALITGRVTGRYRYQGKEDDFVERYTSVWIRDGGAWKLTHEHSSLLPKKKNQQQAS